MEAMFRRVCELITKIPLDPTSTLCAISLLAVAALIWHARPAPAPRVASRRRPPARPRGTVAARRTRPAR